MKMRSPFQQRGRHQDFRIADSQPNREPAQRSVAAPANAPCRRCQQRRCRDRWEEASALSSVARTIPFAEPLEGKKLFTPHVGYASRRDVLWSLLRYEPCHPSLCHRSGDDRNFLSSRNTRSRDRALCERMFIETRSTHTACVTVTTTWGKAPLRQVRHSAPAFGRIEEKASPPVSSNSRHDRQAQRHSVCAQSRRSHQRAEGAHPCDGRVNTTGQPLQSSNSSPSREATEN